MTPPAGGVLLKRLAPVDFSHQQFVSCSMEPQEDVRGIDSPGGSREVLAVDAQFGQCESSETDQLGIRLVLAVVGADVRLCSSTLFVASISLFRLTLAPPRRPQWIWRTSEAFPTRRSHDELPEVREDRLTTEAIRGTTLGCRRTTL